MPWNSHFWSVNEGQATLFQLVYQNGPHLYVWPRTVSEIPSISLLLWRSRTSRILVSSFSSTAQIFLRRCSYGQHSMMRYGVSGVSPIIWSSCHFIHLSVCCSPFAFKLCYYPCTATVSDTVKFPWRWSVSQIENVLCHVSEIWWEELQQSSSEKNDIISNTHSPCCRLFWTVVLGFLNDLDFKVFLTDSSCRHGINLDVPEVTKTFNKLLLEVITSLWSSALSTRWSLSFSLDTELIFSY